MKHTAQSPKGAKGFTLIEIMMGVLIITVAFVTLSSVFSSISKSILVNKTKTIATNLAQEKIESLKNLSYYRLLVTTSTVTDANFPDMVYDYGTTASYYPEEILVVGELTFRRRVYVEFVKQEGGDFVGQPWTANDSGIKRITVYVVWYETDGWKKVELRNLRNNPNRAQLEYSFTGKVTSGTAGPIYNALVETLQNPSYSARTDANGDYSFKVQPGTYTLRASATGYFAAISTNYVVSVDQLGTTNRDFSLTVMAQGSATGYAYVQDHLVITQIVASTDVAGASGQEWIELYNPTTYQILIASRSSPASLFDVFFVTVAWIDDDNKEPDIAPANKGKYLVGSSTANGTTGSAFASFRSTSPHWTADTSTIGIPSHSYFLIANRSTITFTAPSGFVEKIADAYYYGTQIDNNNAGGIRVTGTPGVTYNGRSDWQDAIAWSSSVGDNSPAKPREGSAGFDLSGLGGFISGGVLYRMAQRRYLTDDSHAHTITKAYRTEAPFRANNFDRNESGPDDSTGSDWSGDYLNLFVSNSSGVFNSDTSMEPMSGTPAEGASVSVNDGLSAVSFVQTYGSYTVTNIATGAWTVTISSDFFVQEITTVTIAPSITTGVPNGATTPAWNLSGLPAVYLTSSTIYGYVSGVVRDISGGGMNNVTVSAPGAVNVQTNAQGRYRMNVIPSGSDIAVTASKSGYSTEIVQNIGLAVGMNVSTANFMLVSAGSIRGFVTTNGNPSGALPGIPVLAYDLSSTTVLGSAITGVDGSFTITSVTTGTCYVAPQLETGETSSPDFKQITVTAVSTGTWTSTFTVSNAFGEISGTVGTGSAANPITTGVLVVISTSALASDNPPAVDATVRAGSQVYYTASSDASGRYAVPIRGNATYYIYGWYPTSVNVGASSAPKRQVSGTTYVGPGQSIQKHIFW